MIPLLLHDCNFVTVMNCGVNVCYAPVTHKGISTYIAWKPLPYSRWAFDIGKGIWRFPSLGEVRSNCYFSQGCHKIPNKSNFKKETFVLAQAKGGSIERSWKQLVTLPLLLLMYSLNSVQPHCTLNGATYIYGRSSRLNWSNLEMPSPVPWSLWFRWY